MCLTLTLTGDSVDTYYLAIFFQVYMKPYSNFIVVLFFQ